MKLYEVKIKSSILNSTALINFELTEPTDSLRIEMYDSHGDNGELVFEGTLPAGLHPFRFTPKYINRPFIVVLKMADKVELMKVVKFNSF